MKTLVITFLFLCCMNPNLFAQEKETVTLTIEVSVTKYHKGNILLALYNSEEDYMEKVYKSSTATVKDGKAIIEFKEIAKGNYAFSLFHDVNSNNKLDKNFFGIPKEPYAFSNNEKGSFGPPKYKKAQFSIHSNKNLNVTIK